MAVSTEVYRSEHAWTGVENSFNTGWPAALAAYVKGVFRSPSGVETPLVQGVNYSVSIGPGSRLVTCAPISIPGAAGTLVFYRETPATVSIQLQDNLNTPASVHQDLHDRAAMRDGEQRGQIARALVLPPGASETGAYEMGGRQLQNVGQPTQPSHVARLIDIQDIVAGGGNVPAPTAGQIGSLLLATAANAFGWAGSPAIKAFIAAADAAAARTVLGGSAIGQSIFTAADAAAARTALGGSAIGQSIFTAADVAAIIALLQLTNKTVPPGAVQYFPFQTPPQGWLEANGALVSRAAYSSLFAAANADGLVSEATWLAGNTGRFSVGDGSTTFRLPELRGEFLRGWDNSRGVDASRAAGSFQSFATKVGLTNDGGIVPNNIQITSTGNTFRLQTNGTTAISNQNPVETETRPRNVALLVCIKT